MKDQDITSSAAYLGGNDQAGRGQAKDATTRPYRGILIDPWKRELRNLDVARGLDGLYAAVFQDRERNGKRIATSGDAMVEVTSLLRIDLWLDEEGKLHEPLPEFYLGNEGPFTGYGVVLGRSSSGEDSANAPAWLNPESLATTVSWVDQN